MKFTSLADYSPLEWLEKTLIWRHFAPTTYDNLSIHPYFNSDPFIMRECPDIYFVGNMEKYATKFVIGMPIKYFIYDFVPVLSFQGKNLIFNKLTKIFR